jgi:hypothetical protein
MLLLLSRFETDVEVLDGEGPYVLLFGRSPLHEAYMVACHLP